MSTRLSTMHVLKKTYPFVVLRFVVIVLTVLPIVGITLTFTDFFFRLFGLDVDGFVYTVFWLNFAMIGCMVGVTIMGFVRKTLLFYVKAAHVIAITKICTDDVGESPLVLDSLREVSKRFMSVNLFYIADGLMLKGIRDIGALILNQDVLPQFKIDRSDTSFIGGCKNLVLKLAGSTVEKTLSYCDEFVLSYVFLRSRIEELYGNRQDDSNRPGRRQTQQGRKKETVKVLFSYAVDGICLYVRNCLPLMKRSFTVVLSVTIFGWIVTVASSVVIFSVIGSSVTTAVALFLSIRIIYAVITYTFVEPYETAALLTESYMIMYDDRESLNLDQTRDRLLPYSAAFKKMVAKALGRSEAQVNAQPSASSEGILGANLRTIARDSIGGLLIGEELSAPADSDAVSTPNEQS